MDKLHQCCGDVGGEQQRVGRSTGEEKAESWIMALHVVSPWLVSTESSPSPGRWQNEHLAQPAPSPPPISSLVGTKPSQTQPQSAAPKMVPIPTSVNRYELEQPPAFHPLIPLPHLCGEKTTGMGGGVGLVSHGRQGKWL